MGKKRAYSASPSITSGDRCRASLPGLGLLLGMGGWWRPMGAASHQPHARSLRPNATQDIGPNPVPTRRYIKIYVWVWLAALQLSAMQPSETSVIASDLFTIRSTIYTRHFWQPVCTAPSCPTSQLRAQPNVWNGNSSFQVLSC